VPQTFSQRGAARGSKGTMRIFGDRNQFEISFRFRLAGHHGPLKEEGREASWIFAASEGREPTWRP
jgi:hypothetical protein